MTDAVHYAAFNAHVDDSCTRRKSGYIDSAKSELLEAAAGEGGTVNRDWCN